ncbi:AraC-like ligand-binding domain-containing protein [Microbacterium gorillae]|uniref:AraC-like ligand-binding domain-containing protein n=1 Tax=Microbacterium gorillae TaxID=1231063 RepID=UPI00058FEDA5|nr:helix-turn-helix domain-containing protein [Microbacterium gorillae]
MSPSIAATTAPPSAGQMLRLGGITDFRDVVNRSFVPLTVTSQRPHHFHATVQGQMLDRIGLTEVVADPHVVERTWRLCADGGTPANYKISLMLSGSGYLCQDGRDVLLNPGDLAIYDTTRPYTLAFDDSFRSIIAMFPKSFVPLDETSVGRLTARTLGGDDPMGAIVASMLRQATGQLGLLTPAVGGRLAHTMVDLVSILLREQLETDPDPRQETLLARIRDHILANLDDPALGPGSIAAAHYISVRYLHAVFQREGTTVAAHIRQLRLERCRDDLTDPRLADETVTRVASRWSFSDAAHFSRLFKATYGETPSAFRAARLHA